MATSQAMFWPRWKALPPGWAKCDTGHTERAFMIRADGDTPPALPKKSRRRIIPSLKAARRRT